MSKWTDDYRRCLHRLQDAMSAVAPAGWWVSALDPTTGESEKRYGGFGDYIASCMQAGYAGRQFFNLVRDSHCARADRRIVAVIDDDARRVRWYAERRTGPRGSWVPVPDMLGRVDDVGTDALAEAWAAARMSWLAEGLPAPRRRKAVAA